MSGTFLIRMKWMYPLIMTAASVLAQEASFQRMVRSRNEVTAFLEREARRITARAAAEVTDRAQWESVRARRLEEMRDMLGLLPWPERTPLKVRITGKLDKTAYTVEKIAFESLPGIYVTGNLYVPAQRAGRVPAVIYVCGHSYTPQGDKAAYQRHGISLARNGYVAFILDSIQIAETFALHHGIYNQEMYDWYARGYTPAGVEVWNAMRAIDYLETRPEVDAAKIGMTGRSGGAAMTWFTAAVDPRVKVAAPVMGISTYEENLKANTQKLHCDCMFAINTHLHDMMHQAALIAPRPLLMAHGRLDALFPVPGYKDVEKRMQTLFGAYQKPEGFRAIEVETGHEDSHFLREQAIRWFDRFLLGQPDRKLDMDYSEAPKEELAVFPAGPPADAANYRVHETFNPVAVLKPYASRASWDRHAAGVMTALREKVFRAFPSEPAAPRWRKLDREPGNPFDVIEIDVDGVAVRTLVQAPRDTSKPMSALLYIASDGDDVRALSATLRAPRGNSPHVRMVVYPRGVGEVPWEKSFWKDTLRNAMHTGWTVDSMRLWDVLRAVTVLRAQPGVAPEKIAVTGSGVSGALGLYAALLDPRIEQVILRNPPPSHTEGPIFLNVLRHLDMPEAVAMMAPRRVSFYGRTPAAFEPARAVYALFGKGGHLFTGMDLEAMLSGRYDHGFASGM